MKNIPNKEKWLIIKSLSYRILLSEEPEGGYSVTVPTLPGCITYGETIEEARKMAKESIELYIESLIANNEEIPTEEHTFETTVLLDNYAWFPFINAKRNN